MDGRGFKRTRQNVEQIGEHGSKHENRWAGQGVPRRTGGLGRTKWPGQIGEGQGRGDKVGADGGKLGRMGGRSRRIGKSEGGRGKIEADGGKPG